MRYVLSPFEPHAVKNAVKNSMCSLVAFVPEAFRMLYSTRRNPTVQKKAIHAMADLKRDPLSMQQHHH
jgi:hypothetical protein